MELLLRWRGSAALLAVGAALSHLRFALFLELLPFWFLFRCEKRFDLGADRLAGLGGFCLALLAGQRLVRAKSLHRSHLLVHEVADFLGLVTGQGEVGLHLLQTLFGALSKIRAAGASGLAFGTTIA